MAMANFDFPAGNKDTLLRRQADTLGCFSGIAPLSSVGTYRYQSSSHCSSQCANLNKAVAATTNGNECYCGDEIPDAGNRTDESYCNAPCTGYGSANCGGVNAWTVYLTGIDSNVATYSASSSSSTTSADPTSSSDSPSVVTSVIPGGQTVVVTTTASPENSGNHTNTTDIAAGVVVGVVALAAIIGGVFVWLRNHKRKEAEHTYQQQTQVAEFMKGGRSRGFSHAYSSSSDQRLDPEAGRRNSVGSLADSEDYSRKILRVANPDSS